MAIQVSKLTKRFKDFIAVNDVSVDIERGETFALLGPNGSGKTTTLKCLVGLTLPTAGKITVDGLDVGRQARAAKRLMSFLPQRVGFSDQLTGREVLEFYCRLRHIPSQRIDETINTPDFHLDRKSTRLNSSHLVISYAVFCLKKKIKKIHLNTK